MIGNWPGILAAPSIALANLSIVYALVPRACSSQDMKPLHIVTLMSLLLCLAAFWICWRNWKHTGTALPASSDAAAARARLLAMLGMLLAALSALVVLAQWLPQWMLSPCTG